MSDSAYERIESLLTLPKGWDAYDADPPSAVAAENAKRTLQIMRELGAEPDRIDASVEGGIGLSYVRSGRYSDIECFNDGEILASIAKSGVAPDIWQVESSDEALLVAIKHVALPKECLS